MKRDMDLIRIILLRVEERSQFSGRPQEMGSRITSQVISASSLGITDHSDEEVLYNIGLLFDAGFLDGKKLGIEHAVVFQLTWNGHEFLDSIRDSEVWRETKRKAKIVGGVGVGFLWEIAKTILRAKLGIP